MTATENSWAIVLMVMALFGGPLVIKVLNALVAQDHELVIYHLTPIGWALAGLCCLVVLIGVWIDQ